ncbi:MAG: CRISPR-associated protein [Parabacteroides sp.]|nr:CRISPR-associated protein [Parabacteroides sp.]
MFINLSNHLSQTWSTEQMEAARQYGGNVVDMPFPAVSAMADENDLAVLVKEYAHDIISHYDPHQDVFHVMGEMCFSFALVRLLQQAGFVCVASTSERLVQEREPGHKEVFFHFIRFRRYEI